MNAGVQYSLLDCPADFSVQVATFRGHVIIDQKEVDKVERTGRMASRLTEAAEKSHRLTQLLRKRGIEAYEFHDRNQSIVTVGSFNSVGTPRDDGRLEINARILKVIENFGAQQTPLPLEWQRVPFFGYESGKGTDEINSGLRIVFVSILRIEAHNKPLHLRAAHKSSLSFYASCYN